MTEKHENDPFGSIPISQQNSEQSDIGISVSEKTGTPEPKFSRKGIKHRKKQSSLVSFFKLSILAFFLFIIGYLLSGYYLFPYLLKTYGAEAIASKINVYDFTTGELYSQTNTDEEGHYRMTLEAGKKYKLVVLGEPHGTHYLEKLPIIIPFFTKNLKCAFIEQPYQLQQGEEPVQ